MLLSILPKEVQVNRPSRGFTQIELLICVLIISALASIAYPIITRAKQSAKVSVCAAKVRQIGAAHLLYSADYSDSLPVETNAIILSLLANRPQYGSEIDHILLNSPVWPTAVRGYGISDSQIKCPLDGQYFPNASSTLIPNFEAFGTSYVYDSLGALFYRSWFSVPKPHLRPLLYEEGFANHGSDGTELGRMCICMTYDLKVKNVSRGLCLKESDDD